METGAISTASPATQSGALRNSPGYLQKGPPMAGFCIRCPSTRSLARRGFDNASGDRRTAHVPQLRQATSPGQTCPIGRPASAARYQRLSTVALPPNRIFPPWSASMVSLPVTIGVPVTACADVGKADRNDRKSKAEASGITTVKGYFPGPQAAGCCLWGATRASLRCCSTKNMSASLDHRRAISSRKLRSPPKWAQMPPIAIPAIHPHPMLSETIDLHGSGSVRRNHYRFVQAKEEIQRTQ